MISIDLGLARTGFSLDARAELPTRGITGVFGPSGCGKTTLLRCIAGLERPEGVLRVGDELWQDSAVGCFVAPHARGVGYVFQGTALFPHLDVRGNLAYGERRTPPAQRRVRFAETVELLALGPLLGRRVAGLSGGERQRVAIGRALLASPRVLLLDEPLAAVDRPARREILPYLEQLHAELAIPVLYVTHARDEVLRLADHLVLMAAGRVTAHGPLHALVDAPESPWSGDQDAAAVIEGSAGAYDAEFGLNRVAFSGGELLVPGGALAAGRTVRIVVHARDVSLALERPGGTSILNIFPARVTAVNAGGEAQALVTLDLRGSVLRARITRRSVHALGIVPGRQVHAQVKSVALLR